MFNRYLILIILFVLIIFFGLLLKQLFFNKLVLENSNSQIQITTSFYPLYFFASQIAGDQANVINITPAGAEPHDYEPTIQDRANIEKSRLLILNGGLEAWGEKIQDDLKDKNVTVFKAGESLTYIEKDPHVWLSPTQAITLSNNITNALIKADPENEATYLKNYGILSGKLKKLNEDFQAGLSNCKAKDIITAHAAFGYLAKSYGLNQISIAGLSPDAEPSAKQLSEIAKFAKANNMKYIFFESLVSPKLAETLANEIGAETLVLDPLEGLSNDDIKDGKNYFTVMQNNLTNLKIALGCN